MSKYIKLLAIIAITGILFPTSSFADSYCGDGNKNEGEQCDDGNFINRDGCSSRCELEDMEPPTVTATSIKNGATGVSTLIKKVTINFSEKIDPETIDNNTVILKHAGKPLDIDFDIQDNQTALTININQDLFSEAEHAIFINHIKDIVGNQMIDAHITVFKSAIGIDHTPPNVVANPSGGEYHVAQSVSVNPYIGNYTKSEEFIDSEATVYYTLDNSIPTKDSPIYESPISLKKNVTLKYFGIDAAGNRSNIKTDVYRFNCAERENAKKVSPYPLCRVQECEYGFVLKSNVCVIRLGGNDIDDYRLNAVTAPLFPSDTPVTISSKPAIHVTAKHRGLINRPVIFKDYKTGTIVEFEKNTKITQMDGKAFAGYIKPPYPLYNKSFPINFGYSFKSIFKFGPIVEDGEEKELVYEPSYKITIPYSDRYDADEDVTIFIYNPETEQYREYGKNLVSVDREKREVTITSDRNNTFFVAQKGKVYNRSEFKDMNEHWAKNYAEALYRKGIVKGRSKGIYAPDEILTRAEFTKIALNAIAEEVNPLENVENAPFHDVPLYAWYIPYVKRAKELGLINGYPDGSFKPDQPIQRAEAIKILINAFKFNLSEYEGTTDGKDIYKDVFMDQWYYPAANFVIKNELLDGIRNRGGKIISVFGPGRSITRGEMAKLAIKTIELKEEMGKK